MKLAIVDDVPDCAIAAQKTLAQAGYSVEVFQSASAFRRAFRSDTFDLVCLDWSMPEESGIELLGWVRECELSKTPVIMISARSEGADVIDALNRGADDYVTKPYEAEMLNARVKAVVRRSYDDLASEAAVRLAAVVLEPVSKIALVDGRPVDLTPKEFQLALTLFKNVGRPMARNYLLETIWGVRREVDTRTLETHVAKVRAKLGLRAEKGIMLQTIYGFGYRLELVEDPARSTKSN